jgi:Lon protease-like protein
MRIFLVSPNVKKIADQKLNLPTHAPLMVLPGAQLFPNALLPLYIFEPRYRAMLTWSLEQHRMFCIAPMKAGVSEADSTDDFHHLIGLGLVRASVGHEDGTSHLVLQGIARVRITGFLQDAPFRIAEVREVLSQPANPEERENLTTKLLEICALLRAQGATVPESLDQQLAQIEDPALLADIIAHTFLRDPERRQIVFEELRVAERARLVIRFLLAEESSSGEDS